MSPAAHEILETARVLAGMSFEELWLAYVGLGGHALPAALQSYLDGSGPDPRADDPGDYDLVAQAINERFVEQGSDHPVPYRDELT